MHTTLKCLLATNMIDKRKKEGESSLVDSSKQAHLNRLKYSNTTVMYPNRTNKYSNRADNSIVGPVALNIKYWL